MKKLFATIACVAFMSVGFMTQAFAQDAATDSAAAAVAAAVEETDAPAAETIPAAEEASFHQALKTKFIEGGPEFMATIAITLILGLAICLERIIYLNLADTNNEKFLAEIDQALERGDVEGAKKNSS